MLGSNRTKKPTHAEDRQAIVAAAAALDERRQEQIRLQVASINRLLVRLNAFEMFCEERDLEEEAKIFVADAIEKAARESLLLANPPQPQQIDTQ